MDDQPDPTTPASETLVSPTGERLLRIAADVARGSGTPDSRPLPLSEFVQTYREWIVTSRGKSEPQPEQAERWQLILYAMVTADDVEEAIRRLIRFGKVVWGARGPGSLRREGDKAVLAFNEPFRDGPEGLIAAIWMLALTLCELEFLSNARFDGVSGRVVHDPCLSDGIVRLLFAPPVTFGAGEVALVFPLRHLHRPVTARAGDLPDFFGRLLPLTLGVDRAPPSIRSMTAGLIRDDKLGPDYRAPTLVNVAARLGMSTATLRRRLGSEATSYRSIKESVYDRLAQDWLVQGNIPVEEVARRLDFSDAFSFRRFFRRRNGTSPSRFVVAYNKREPENDEQVDLSDSPR